MTTKPKMGRAYKYGTPTKSKMFRIPSDNYDVIVKQFKTILSKYIPKTIS